MGARSVRILLDFVILILYKIDKSGRWHFPVLLMGAILCLFVSTANNQFQQSSGVCGTEDGPSRPVLTSSFATRDLWSTKFNKAPGSFAYASNLLIVETGCEDIIAFDLKTGHIVWRTEKPVSGYLTPDETRNRLYVASPRGVYAVSLAEGKSLWFQDASPLWGRGYPPVRMLDDGRVTVDLSGIWELNPDTGSLRPISYPMPFYTTLACGDIAYTAEAGVIRAIRRSTNEILWSTQTGERSLTGAVNYCDHNHPLLVRWGGLSTWLTALDRQTGKILWDIKDDVIVSNVVVANRSVYVLDEEARLLVHDLYSGVERGTIQFKPPTKTRLLYEPGAIGGSWLAVSGDITAIYFNDTRNLAVVTANVAGSTSSPQT